MEVSSNLPCNDESIVSNIVGSRAEEECNSSDDNIVRGHGSIQRRRNFTESDSDVDNAVGSSVTSPRTVSNHKKTKSRIKKICDSDSDSQSSTQETSTSISRVSRIENKRIKLHNKFKKLVTAQAKTSIVESDAENQLQASENEISEKSDEEISCLKIKKKIMKKKSVLSSICDADISDDDVDAKIDKIKQKRKAKSKPLKSTIEIQPKMSAKQAMENMQKIKSESNRMLREKDVTLPYHKPRALSLQDIMNRKKPTLTSNGKAMPIKMNSEQLAQYVNLLEERQKEIIELCKSDSEEEASENPVDENNTNVEPENVCKEINNDNNQDLEKSSDNHFDEVIQEINNEANKECNSSVVTNIDETKDDSSEKTEKPNSEAPCQNSSSIDSQAITLNFDSKKTAVEEENLIDAIKDNEEKNDNNSPVKKVASDSIEIEKSNTISEQKEICDNFSDDDNDFNLEDIDSIIENAEIIKDIPKLDPNTTHTASITTQSAIKPKLTGAPGMLIDLEDGDQTPKVLTGVELLKERYTYFSKLKSLEDLENNRTKKLKPGTQHLKLKHELEEQIAEQRSLEWEKRLQEERQLKSEMNIEPDDDIEKLEAKLEDDEAKESSSSEDEDLVEDDVDMQEKPRKSNPMIDDEAEESDHEEDNINEGVEDDDELVDNADNDSSDDSTDDSSSESEDEKSKPKKGRILKAFEDSDDESNSEKVEKQITPVAVGCPENVSDKDVNDMQDDEIQLAQFNRSISDDIFASQDSHNVNQSITAENYKNSDDIPCTADLGSQTFSILASAAALNKKEVNLEDTLSVTQSIDESKFEHFNKNCSESLTQNLLISPRFDSQTQEIGDDIAALCTGKFYDNPFVTQMQDNETNSQGLNISKEKESKDLSSKEREDELTEKASNEINQNPPIDISQTQDIESNKEKPNNEEENQEDKNKPTEDSNILKSILDELNEPEIETTNKFFVAKQNNVIKKRFIIDSDEENDEGISKEKKKLKKRKPEKRALQISDDEEEEASEGEEEEESEMEEEEEKIVEYDSEENEIEVKAKPIKKKRVGEFFENEAELTSEDEWVGSGDEDEVGLDRMEREEGDSEVFQQEQLQRELGQIHMREVLDQDKREVRLLQELLFEDGDLGDGHRQRKFRWKTDADGDDDTGMGLINLTDTQEEEFESEELWRKQRHERELFLRSMQEKEEEKVDISTNRTAMIKTNLNSSNVSDVNETKQKTETEASTHVEAKSTKDIPSPKKSFLILKQSYHGSLLSGGRGSLARLAALASPLVDADAPRPAAAAAAPAAGNFVFATLSQPEPERKVAKRKAETNAGTPKLLKKLKQEDTQKYLKKSLFDHIKT